ncbi:hypothetical protein D9M68_608660 [compost metagenome]
MLDTMLIQFPNLEQEAFREACLRNGVAPDGFTVTAVEDATGAAPAGGRSITVRFGREVRQYDGSVSAQWTVDFEDDLKSRVFG